MTPASTNKEAPPPRVVLITGAAGYIGSLLTSSLVADGAGLDRIVATDIRPDAPDFGAPPGNGHERAGPRLGSGSITAMYTVLMEGDDLTDPVADAAMAILDGQVVLSRRLAGRGHYPAVDVLRSTSRVMPDVADAEHLANAQRIREVLSLLAESEDLGNIGAYQPGKNPRLDDALARKAELTKFLRQEMDEFALPQDSLRWMAALGAPLQGGLA